MTNQPNYSINLLTKLWSKRYMLDFSVLNTEPTSFLELIEFASPQGKAKTVSFLRRLLKLDCEWGVAMTNALFNGQHINPTNTSQMAHTIELMYDQALTIYEQQPSFFTTQLTTTINAKELSTAFEHQLATLRQQHKLATEPRSIGFISTQFYYTGKLLLDQLSLPEQILLSPYLRFLEEQVCIPFQQVCLGADKLEIDSPTLAIIQQILFTCHDIAKTVYRRAVKLYQSHESRRGKLSHPGVMVSTIRDLEMMQGYLCLSLLENSFAAVEQELIPLCVLVFPNMQVTWDLVQRMLEMLMDEVLASVEQAHQPLLRSYTLRMQYLFSKIDHQDWTLD